MVLAFKHIVIHNVDYFNCHSFSHSASADPNKDGGSYSSKKEKNIFDNFSGLSNQESIFIYGGDIEKLCQNQIMQCNTPPLFLKSSKDDDTSSKLTM